MDTFNIIVIVIVVVIIIISIIIIICNLKRFINENGEVNNTAHTKKKGGYKSVILYPSKIMEGNPPTEKLYPLLVKLKHWPI